MAVEVTMPQMGESVVEGTIAKWLVKEGDLVTEDQPLVEISTDKVDTEIPSPSAGRIAKLVAEEGQIVPVGAVIAVIEPVIEKNGAAQKAQAPTPPPPPSKPPLLAPAPAPAPTSQVTSAVEERREGEHRRYSPVVVRIAAEHGLDIAQIPGTGIGGRVSKRDVLTYLESLGQGVSTSVQNGVAAAALHPTPGPAPAKPAAPIPSSASTTGGYHPPVDQPREGDIVEPFTRRRKLIAEHMVYSKMHSPHVGTLAEVNLTKLTRLREAHKKAFQDREGFALTMLPLAAAATVRALKEFPRMNASVVGDSWIVRKQINLGIAMDSDEGLLVPVIKAAEGMSVVGLAREIERLRRKVQEKKITADDLSGGSFTLSNPGREGNLFGFAIINQPQVGILRMGEVKKRPVAIEVDGTDAIAIRTMMYLALSYDHRVVDGVLGNSFLYRTARIMEEADFEL
jgi:2-oxoglutarate dehydrogenase E2 component (dihydrolipoamide succinyltransferase)